MCAILDASVVSQVFGKKCPPAGRAFFNWIANRHGRLAVGGYLSHELARNGGFREWIRGALLSGKAERLNNKVVDETAEKLRNDGLCRSRDQHVIALAQLSGARLLYSNDRRLNRDFEDPRLVPPPYGSVYTTLDLEDKAFTAAHQELLDRKDMCPRHHGQQPK